MPPRMRFIVVFFILTALCAPSLLCVLPLTGLSLEHLCCKHMTNMSAGDMSDCCTTLIPNLSFAAPELAGKSPALYIVADNAGLSLDVEIHSVATPIDPQGYVLPSVLTPPPIRILRI